MRYVYYRTWAREKAFQLLFQLDSRIDDVAEQKEQFIDVLARNSKALEDSYVEEEAEKTNETALVYLRQLSEGVLEKQAELDELIQGHLKAWKLSRLSKVDRSLLRLGSYEIMYMDEVPKSVCINEMVLLAKRYGTEESRAFVNGVLATFDKKVDIEKDDIAKVDKVDIEEVAITKDDIEKVEES